MKVAKKAGALALAVTITAALAFGGGASRAKADGGVRIMLDGYPLPFPVEPVITASGYTMVPFRAISEALGIAVDWNATQKTIAASKRTEDGGTRQVLLRLNDGVAQVDGQAVSLGAAPYAENGHTLIPLSFFSRQFGADVAWDGATRTVAIGSPKSAMYTLGFYALSSFSERALVNRLDAIAFGWSRIDRDGRFTTGGDDFKWPQPAGDVTPERLVGDAEAAGTMPYLMVFAGDGQLELTGLLADRTKQDEAIARMVDAARSGGFRGLLLDLEGLGLTGDRQAARESFNGFVGRTAEAARADGLKLAIAVPPLNGAFGGYDYKTLGELADELIVMAYAYGDEKSPEPADKVDEAIRLALAETPKEKLVLGISLASENAQSVNVKIGLAKRYGLKGIAIWRLGLIGSEAVAQMERSIDFDRS